MNRDATAVVQNACKLCTPLGAALAFKGIEGVIPLLHGSQGCATYIRRYLISHFREPVDIASSNFSEEATVFGGASNLMTALDNIIRQYDPQMIGIATTCLAETIGDDVPGLLREYTSVHDNTIPMLHVSTPAYRGTHMDGFHAVVYQTVDALTCDLPTSSIPNKNHVNLFPGMLSPADLRHLKTIMSDFNLAATLLPDYSQTLDGVQWDVYQKIPCGGTPLQAIREMGSAAASLEFGRVLMHERSAAKLLLERFNIPYTALGFPIGVRESDAFFQTLEALSCKPSPTLYTETRNRLIDAYVDGHKYVSGKRAAVFGEEDLVIGLASFLSEIGIQPVLCASGGKSAFFETALRQVIPDFDHQNVQVLSGADFHEISEAAKTLKIDLLIGNSKGFPLSREMNIPLVRVGFPLHDRFGGGRVLHVGYHGAQQLFDQIVNCIIEYRQESSEIGYTYI